MVANLLFLDFCHAHPVLAQLEDVTTASHIILFCRFCSWPPARHLTFQAKMQHHQDVCSRLLSDASEVARRVDRK